MVFVGGEIGEWEVELQQTLLGPALPNVRRIAVQSGDQVRTSPIGAWTVRGVTTNDRYTTRSEKSALLQKQAPIGRPEATRAALILLRKRPEWWAMAQDERREILEEQSHHITIGMRYLPAVARRLLYCRDLGTLEPFDFLGYLDYAPENAALFEELLAQLRATTEWTYIDREVEIRLTKCVRDRALADDVSLARRKSSGSTCL